MRAGSLRSIQSDASARPGPDHAPELADGAAERCFVVVVVVVWNGEKFAVGR